MAQRQDCVEAGIAEELLSNIYQLISVAAEPEKTVVWV